MKTMQINVAVILALTLFISCKNVDTKAEAEILLEIDKAFSAKSVQTNAPDAFFEFMTEDALQLPAGASPIYGRKAVRDNMQTDYDYELSWYPQHAEVAKYGDMGYTWGYYEFKIDGDKEVRHGKYLNVWEKQKDGSWKVAVDLGNSNPKPELPKK